MRTVLRVLSECARPSMVSALSIAGALCAEWWFFSGAWTPRRGAVAILVSLFFCGALIGHLVAARAARGEAG